jgi:phthalate 4,5-dioxygenase oxygenase subunit
MNREENDLLTRVENGAPLGEMIRQHHWVPALRAGLLEPDGQPVRVRLLGENFVAFRASDRRIGFFAEACPHRGASLALARNEDCALTCIYHGLQIDVSGTVRNVPTAPGAGTAIRVRHFPVREAGGLVWAWLGPESPGRFPDLPIVSLPTAHVAAASVKIPVNFLQLLEITLDTSHTGILHRNWHRLLPWPYNSADTDPSSVFEVEETNYGFRAAAIRKVEAGSEVLTSEFVMPFHNLAAPGPPHQGVQHTLVPIDDTNTLWFMVHWNERKPLGTVGELGAKSGGVDGNKSFGMPGKSGGFLGQDRDAMRSGSFSGFAGGLMAEDIAVVLSMGPIADRTTQQLVPADRAILQLRDQLLRATREHLAGHQPFGTDASIDYASLMAVAGEIPSGSTWQDVVSKRREIAKQDRLQRQSVA